jgi:P-type E1-E2 ATPase
MKNGRIQTIQWKDIQCGDIVEVPVDSEIPCDMLLLYSATDNCYIKTSSLDGETNLKKRQVPSKFTFIKDVDNLLNLQAVISCEKPNTRLYEFKGNLLYQGQI